MGTHSAESLSCLVAFGSKFTEKYGSYFFQPKVVWRVLKKTPESSVSMLHLLGVFVTSGTLNLYLAHVSCRRNIQLCAKQTSESE